MTSNQIAYANVQESKRHNQAVETETNRHQVMQEKLANWQNAINKWQVAVNNLHYTRMDAETERANRAREAYNYQALGETYRSNVANEGLKDAANRINAASVAEQRRHQMASEQETSRHQKAVEAEQVRYDDAMIGKLNSDTGYTESKTKSEDYSRTFILPTQPALNQSQTGLNTMKADTEVSVRFRNVMAGFSDGINAVSNLFGTITNVIKPVSPGKGGGSKGGSTSFFDQLEDMQRQNGTR